MSCYGADYMDVPNLNALADESFVFQNAYVSQPVCTPARATIMTGLYPHTAGPIVNMINLPEDAKVISEMISDDHYKGYMGKWHLGNDIERQHGFNVWRSSEDGHGTGYTHAQLNNETSTYTEYLVSKGYTPDRKPAANAEGRGFSLLGRRSGIRTSTFSSDAHYDMPEEDQMASYLAQEACEFIDENKDRPFVLYVSTFEPHSPYHGPFMDQYDPETLPVGPAFLEKPESASLVNKVRADYFMKFMLDGEDQTKDPYMMNYAASREDVTTEIGWRTLRAHYMGNITLVDRMVGRINQAIKDAGIEDDTIIVFTSEHGDMMGDHGMLEKRSMFEEASRVPLLMKVPWLSKSQKIIEGSVGHIDLVPTLLDLIGEDVPDHLQGKSLQPVLQGDEDLSQNDVFISWNGYDNDVPDRFLGDHKINRMLRLPWRTVVTPDRWKLALCAGDQCELYDLNNDPYEQTNLFNDPAQQDRIRDMAARIRVWQVQTGDTAPLPTT
jgi:arylsulfatase A-like enzyme